MGDVIQRLHPLLISEVSGVDDPASELPGWLIQKSRGESDLLTALQKLQKAVNRGRDLGVTEMNVDGKGMFVVSNDHVARLRAQGGDAAVEEHFTEIMRALGTPYEGSIPVVEKSAAAVEPAASAAPVAAVPHHSERQPRHKSGRFQGGIWTHVGPQAADARSTFLD